MVERDYLLLKPDILSFKSLPNNRLPGKQTPEDSAPRKLSVSPIRSAKRSESVCVLDPRSGIRARVESPS